MDKSQRDRGRILTLSGLKKLNEAIALWKDENNLRGTLVEIEAESGVGSDTISKIRQGRVGADISKIQQLFTAFNLKLEEVDHRSSKEPAPLEIQTPQISTGEVAKIFISYQKQSPDQQLAEDLGRAIAQVGHQVLMAENHIKLGENWWQKVTNELKQCDYLLLLLPKQSGQSEILTYLVQIAKEMQANRSDRKPIILPVRVGFSLHEPLNHDLRGYLYQIQQAEWFSSQDTPRVLQEILGAIASPITDFVNTLENEDFANLGNQPTVAEQIINHQNLTETNPLPTAEPEIPGGQVGIESTFYMERPPIEERCFQTILQPSALIRIKAPRQLGKTSLMARILASASQANYRTVSLSFQLVDKHIFANLDQFLKWFCAYVGRELNLPNQLNDYWDDIFGSKVNCKDYFEKYLLTQIDVPLVLGLDELDRVFQYPDIAEDFLGLLRAWHEESKRRAIWKKLRLIMVHSTEVYIPMNINQSPFNVGLPIELPEFTPDQILELARRHDLDWSNIEVEQIMSLIGGHPYLIRVALYHIARGDLTLSQWQETAMSEAGIYSDHLRRHLWNLEQNPDLLAAMQQVINHPAGYQLASIIAFKLDSMGLVRLQGNVVTPRCELYRQYLQLHFQ